LFTLARTRLPTALEAKLAAFPSAIVDTHGKDLTISADPSRTGTPAPSGAASAPAPAASTASTAAAPKPKATEKPKVNSTTIVVEADFRASADDLFSLLTDEKRIPAWTRAPAQVGNTLSHT
jgi:activator of HSP90 ATPase